MSISEKERDYWDHYYREQGWTEVAPGWWNPPPFSPLENWIVAKVLPILIILGMVAALVWVFLDAL